MKGYSPPLFTRFQSQFRFQRIASTLVESDPFVIVYDVELSCLACGRQVGMLHAATWPRVGPVLFQADRQSSSVTLRDWTRLRCAICGGNVYADHVSSRRLYRPLRPEELDVPNRGRPPKWLLAQRRAEAQTGDQ